MGSRLRGDDEKDGWRTDRFPFHDSPRLVTPASRHHPTSRIPDRRVRVR